MLLILILGQLISWDENGDVLISNIPSIERSQNVDDELICDTYDHIIRYYGQLYGIDHELIKIIIEKESDYNPNAVSKSGAIGLMQLMPETAEMLGVKDPYNPWENIEGGVKFLRDLFDIFDNNLELTLAAYHAGPGLVRRLNRVPSIPETMEYVDYIISRYSPAQKKNPIYFSFTEDSIPLFTNCPK